MGIKRLNYEPKKKGHGMPCPYESRDLIRLRYRGFFLGGGFTLSGLFAFGGSFTLGRLFTFGGGGFFSRGFCANDILCTAETKQIGLGCRRYVKSMAGA